jgi:sarcosine oxidase
MGSAAAYHLASRGKRVLGLEKFGAAHEKGSSHGDSRIIRLAYHEHPSYVPLARRAYQLWERLERDSHASLVRQTGGLMIGLPGSRVVEGAILSAKQYDLPFQVLEGEEIRRRFPVFHARPEELAVYEAVAGYLRPEAAINAHLQLAVRHGAELHFHEAADEWTAEESGDRVIVKTAAAVYEAERLVIAPGAWAPEILSDLQIPFHVRRHVMCWFQPVADVAKFQPDQFPIYVWDVDGRHCFYGVAATGDAVDGVKAAMHSGGELCAADSIDREIRDADVAEVRTYLRRFLPSLNGPLSRAVTCMYTLTPDEHFVVAVHPRYPQVCVAAGFSGHGFKFTCAIGEILADLATNGRTEQPIGFLSPARFNR